MKLKFLTYNIHKGIGNDRKYNIERIAAVCRESCADFLALQEVSHFFPRSKNDDMAKLISQELGMDYRFELNVHFKRGGYGNALFSRYPIVKNTNVDISLPMKKSRGCLISHIHAASTEIIVMNIHLGLAAYERRRQINKIIEVLKNNDFQDMPLIILGDTNDPQHKLTLTLEYNGLIDTISSFYGPKKLSYTFPSYAPILRLDKIFVSAHWSVENYKVVRTKISPNPSDHLPLLVELRLLT